MEVETMNGFTLRNRATVLFCKPDRISRDGGINGYIVLARTNSSFCSHPFATWLVDLDGNSYHGHYFETLEEAKSDFDHRG
jgi:hypothetical protein